MTTQTADGYLALEVEDYSTRARPDDGSPAGKDGTVPVPVLVWLTLAIAAFMAVAVFTGQIAGAC